MATSFKIHSYVGSTEHVVQEDVEDLTSDVNAAVQTKTKIVTVTGQDGKRYSVVADDIADIREA